MNKREFIKKGIILGAGAFAVPSFLSPKSFAGTSSLPSAEGEFLQAALPYSFNALEPHIDALTMEIHYGKHHAAYTKKFNDSVREEKLEGMTLEQIFSQVDKYSASIRNNGGGYYNHNVFWHCLSPEGGGEPAGKLLNEIEKSFGSTAAFREAFTKTSSSVFGSGWTWLIQQESGLKIVSSANQDNPLMNISPEKGQPLMCLDVWEHAYYLKYQNRRAEYISAFWNLVNWNFVASNLK